VGKGIIGSLLVVFLLFGISESRAQSCGDASVEVLEDEKLVGSLLSLIQGAKKEIWIATYHFKAGIHPRTAQDRIVQELIGAKKRGVGVFVLLERPEDPLSEQARDNLKTARLLERGGVEVLWDRPDRRSHMKVAVVDGRWTIVGSHNLTKGGLRENHELSVKIDSPCVANKVLAYLKRVAREGGTPSTRSRN
jgi:phosphatidylserine/phosphatidylglycerophosphate/cardiolipin synthase-like enzyme